MKVIIAGGRDFDDFPRMIKTCDKILANQESVEIVSGTANGADKLGESYAKARGHPIKRFPADWERFGRSAGHRRNAEMADYGDALILYWDGKSKGSGGMLEIAKKRGLKIRVINY